MQCPVCKNSMVILELDKVEIDYCPSCKGIWLDNGELELLMEDQQSQDKKLKSFKSVNDVPEKKYRCPICNKKMDKVEYEDSQIIIDRCKNEHGLWFDKGELSSLLKQYESNRDNKVLSLLKNIFGD